jgi:hypothetical protein
LLTSSPPPPRGTLHDACTNSQGARWPSTPLIYASRMGHAEMAQLLLKSGASVLGQKKVRRVLGVGGRVGRSRERQ